jgi:hypothetical protein
MSKYLKRVITVVFVFSLFANSFGVVTNAEVKKESLDPARSSLRGLGEEAKKAELEADTALYNTKGQPLNSLAQKTPLLKQEPLVSQEVSGVATLEMPNYTDGILISKSSTKSYVQGCEVRNILKLNTQATNIQIKTMSLYFDDYSSYPFTYTINEPYNEVFEHTGSSWIWSINETASITYKLTYTVGTSPEIYYSISPAYQFTCYEVSDFPSSSVINPDNGIIKLSKINDLTFIDGDPYYGNFHSIFLSNDTSSLSFTLSSVTNPILRQKILSSQFKVRASIWSFDGNKTNIDGYSEYVYIEKDDINYNVNGDSFVFNFDIPNDVQGGLFIDLYDDSGQSGYRSGVYEIYYLGIYKGNPFVKDMNNLGKNKILYNSQRDKANDFYQEFSTSFSYGVEYANGNIDYISNTNLYNGNFNTINFLENGLINGGVYLKSGFSPNGGGYFNNGFRIKDFDKQINYGIIDYKIREMDSYINSLSYSDLSTHIHPDYNFGEWVKNGQTLDAPETLVFDNKLVQTVRGTGDWIYTRTSTDGTNWTNWIKNGQTLSTPNTVVFDNKLVQTVRGTGDWIYTRTSTDGNSWTEWQRNGQTLSTPNTIVFDNKLVQTVRGTGDWIYTRTSTDGTNWTNWIKNGQTLSTPNTVVFDNKLVQTVRGTGDWIYTRTSTDGTNWTNWIKNGKTLSSPNTVVLGDKLVQTVRGTGDWIYTRTSTNGTTWTDWIKNGQSLDEIDTISFTDPAVNLPSLFQTVRGSGNWIYTRQSFDGVNWTEWKKNGQTLSKPNTIIKDNKLIQTVRGTGDWIYTRIAEMESIQ